MRILGGAQSTVWTTPGVGSTDAPTIYGVDVYRTVDSLVVMKALGIKEEIQNDDVVRGLSLEKYIVEHINNKYGLNLVPSKVMDDRFDYIRSSLDGLDIERGIIVEVKCPRKHYDSIPVSYMIQMQHHMLVTGYSECWFVCYSGTLSIVKVARDVTICNRLLELEMSFWDAVLRTRRKIVADIDSALTCCLTEDVKETLTSLRGRIVGYGL